MNEWKQEQLDEFIEQNQTGSFIYTLHFVVLARLQAKC